MFNFSPNALSPIAWKSTKIECVVKSTLPARMMALGQALEEYFLMKPFL